MKINGKTLVQWGFTPGAYFAKAIEVADQMARDNHFGKTTWTIEDMKAEVQKLVPTKPEPIALQDPTTVPIYYNIDVETDYEIDNLEKVKAHMNEIAKVPVIRALAVMPDSCPSGQTLWTIPVGGVAVAENAIIPGFHSADICCSVYMTTFPDDSDPTAILDAAMKIVHFGKGGRPYSHDIVPPIDLLEDFERNPYLSGMTSVATKHYGSSGDGNHFLYVGRLSSTGQIALVTHYGSRKPGAMLYEIGTNLAQKLTGDLLPGISKENYWIPFDTQEGQDYWDALQLIRRWTKGNHASIHRAISKNLGLKEKGVDWNEHNFVFKRDFKGKTYFVHAKGATPNYMGFSHDTTGRVLIPLNMASPILITKVNANYDHGMNFINDPSLGFCPHGAGRNFSRTEFTKRLTESGTSAKQLIAEVEAKYDVRAFSGKHDISEFPGAYKNADQIIAGINKFGLTEVIDKVLPLGCIMAGHDGTDWKEVKRKKKEKAAAKKALMNEQD